MIPGKRRTDALFSVESVAFLCDEHALGGVSMRLAVIPNRSKAASLDAVCGKNLVEKRQKPISQPFSEAA
jgi:hypothetical protein